MDGGKVFQHPGHARPSALACRARQRAPGPCRMLMSAANRIRVTPASERCVSLRSTHPTARGLGQVRGHRRFWPTLPVWAPCGGRDRPDDSK